METFAQPVQRLGPRRRFIRFTWWPHGDESAAVPWWVHLLFGGVLLALDGLVIVFNTINSKHKMPLEQVLTRAVLTDLLSAMVFYLNWMVLIPRTLSRARLGPYVGGVLLLLLVYVLLRVGVSWLVGGPAEDTQTPRHALQMLVPYTLFALMTVFFSSSLRITGDYLQAQRNRRELERRQLLTELSLLKMQVNPHFLFNTLNNIYSLASQKSDRTPEAVLRLSEIMRYMLYESSADTVPLSKELQHLRSFLDLQRLRLPAQGTDAIKLNISPEAATSALSIAPMLLQPLVENAFKHGDLTARPVASIGLAVEAGGTMHFSVENVMPAAPAEMLDQPGGVGLVNLRRRLELLYPGQHSLQISQMQGFYRVALSLWAIQNSNEIPE